MRSWQGSLEGPQRLSGATLRLQNMHLMPAVRALLRLQKYLFCDSKASWFKPRIDLPLDNNWPN